jgi:DNA-binding NtrC family response regulator
MIDVGGMSQTRTVNLVRDAAGFARALRHPRYLLRVVRGPDKRRQLQGSGPRQLIGSGAGAGFQLSDDTVSAIHCEILSDASGFRVRDLGAKNGVLLGGRKVREAWLGEKEDLELGGTILRFEVLEEDEETPLGSRSSFGQLVGSSWRMRELYAQLAKAAASDATVLLQGETGTGKELAASALVTEGLRRDRPFVVLDCGRLPPTLAESELFGHEAGAFTGAGAQFLGAFERAHTGTVFLDEVAELPLPLQAKLLGVLERRTVQRIGGPAPIPVDVRVVAASHVELERAENRGTFRADLFYRLAVVQIRLPALGERREDIPALIAHFLSELPGGGSLPPAILQQLCDAEYGGNVRELRNAVERAVLGLQPDGAAAPVRHDGRVDLEVPYRVQKERLLESFDRAYLVALMEAAGGNVSEAARRSGLSRVHLTTLLQRHRISGR